MITRLLTKLPAQRDLGNRVGTGSVIVGYFSGLYFLVGIWHVGAIFALLSMTEFVILDRINQKIIFDR
jgi:hypothetical protein